VKIQTDGMIVVTGSVGNNLAVARFNSDGNPDASFGTAGLVTTAIQASASGSEVVIQPNGGIVVAGTVNNGNGNQFLNRDFLVARYNGISAESEVTLSGGMLSITDVNGGVSADQLTISHSGSVYTISDNGGTLGGIGTIHGTVTFASGGTLAPGLTTGIIRTGALTLNSASTTKIEIDGVAGAGNTANGHDLIAVTGTATLDGTLTVDVSGITSGEVSIGDTFTIIQSSDPLSGEFSNFTDGDVVASLIGGDAINLSIDYQTNAVVLIAVSPNTPPTANDDDVSTDEDNVVSFSVLGNDTDAEGNIVASLTAAIGSPAAGVLTDNGSGLFSYDPNGAFESLAACDTAQVSFDYQIEDSFGETDSATVTITIDGLNDAASISGNNAGSMTEDEVGSGGVLAVSDVDNGQAVFQPQTDVVGTYGKFSINAAGNWSYTRTSDLQSMAAGEVLADSFTVVSADGTASQLVTITINGVNDAPTITGVTSNHNSISNVSTNGAVTIGGSFADIDLSDTHTVTVNWGDGSAVAAVSVNQLADTLAGSHHYANGGIYTITVTVNDGHGGTAVATTTTAVVQGVGVVNGTLYIIGTNGRDHVNLKFNEKKNELKVDVKLNQGGSDGGSDCGSDGGSDGGSDAAISQFVFGGAGNDHIKGGRGNDVLVGGAGNDDLQGGSGADILIGGIGKDKLKGGRGNDLLIGGSTANEADLALLDEALASWTINDLNGALGWIGTVTDDNTRDDLFGDQGNDYLQTGNGDKRKRFVQYNVTQSTRLGTLAAIHTATTERFA